jgi:hypothetical protein
MKGKETIDWEGFSQAFISQGKTNSRRGFIGGSLNL